MLLNENHFSEVKTIISLQNQMLVFLFHIQSNIDSKFTKIIFTQKGKNTKKEYLCN